MAILGVEGLTPMAVRKRGDKWAVVHCHGAKRGKVIGTHATKETAMRQHRAIQAAKARKRGGK